MTSGLIVSTDARAFFDTLTITPSAPVEGHSYRFSVRVGGCHGVVSTEPLDYQVASSLVRLTVNAGDNSMGAGFCNIPIHTAFFDLPGLPRGDYRFELWRESPLQQLPRQYVGAVDFSVAAGTSEPIAVPAGSLSGWLTLVLSLLFAGAITMRRSRHVSAS